MAPRLMEDADGLVFEYLHEGEAEFLYEEIFTRRSYLRAGVVVPPCGAPVVVDVGANIGLFALLALRDNPCARVIAVEPASAAFAVLERNLHTHAPARAQCHCERLLLRDRAGHALLHCYDAAPGES
eukprot:1067991-Prymnesium_polylepis.1